MLKNKTIKQFWKDTEAISPIVATILVLAVAVAAGVGLYFWFDTFQASAQEEVEATTTSSMNKMTLGALGSDAFYATISKDQSYKVYDTDDVVSTVETYGYPSSSETASNGGNGYIGYAGDIIGVGVNGDYKGSQGQTNTWADERFIVEIPVTVKNALPCTISDVTVEVGTATLKEGIYLGTHWLHLNRDNHYCLQYTEDGKTWEDFCGEITYHNYNGTSYSLTTNPDKKPNYNYVFDTSKAAILLNDTNPPVECSDNWASWSKDLNKLPGTSQSNIWKAGTNDTMRPIKLIDSRGVKIGYAAAYNSSANKYIAWNTYAFANGKVSGSLDKLSSYFEGAEYPIADSMDPDEKKTIYAYLMVSSAELSHFKSTDTDDGKLVAEIPVTIRCLEGGEKKETITLTLFEEG